MTLIAAAKERDVEFVYAISPGLDITFSNPKEVAFLKRKLNQVLLHVFTYFYGFIVILLHVCHLIIN